MGTFVRLDSLFVFGTRGYQDFKVLLPGNLASAHVQVPF